MAKSDARSWAGRIAEIICLVVAEIEKRGMEADKILRRLVSPGGAELIKKIVDILLGVGEATFRLVAKIDRDMTGWKCIEPVDAMDGEFESTLQKFLREGEDYVGGEEMVKRAKEQGALTGIRHTEAMLREQEKIPVEWRKYYLVFPEVWQGSSGNLCVWYLFWNGDRWRVDCNWLDNGFNSHGRVVSSRKCQK